MSLTCYFGVILQGVLLFDEDDDEYYDDEDEGEDGFLDDEDEEGESALMGFSGCFECYDVISFCGDSRLFLCSMLALL
jgi:hypothetical protein